MLPSNQYDYIELKYDEALLEAASMVAGISSEKFSSLAPWQTLVLTKLNLYGEAALLKVLIPLNFITLPIITAFLYKQPSTGAMLCVTRIHIDKNRFILFSLIHSSQD